MNMTSQYCESDIERGCSVFTLNPSVNEVEWAEIENIGNNILNSIEGRTTPSVLVDLTKLEYMGSAMVALIVRVWKKVDKQGGKMIVANKHELVYEVLKLAGLTKMWTIVNTREEGLRQLGGGGVAGAGNNKGLILLGVVSVVGALAGLGVLLSNSSILPQKAALVVEFGFAAFGIIVGTLLFSKPSGSSRGIGLLFIVACLAIAVCGIVNLPTTGAVAVPPGGKPDSQANEGTEEPKADAAPDKGAAIPPEPESKPESKPAKEPQGDASKKPEPKPKASAQPDAKEKEADKPEDNSKAKKPE